METSAFIKINPADSVVVCLRPIKEGEVINVDNKAIKVLQDTRCSSWMLPRVPTS